MIATLVASFLLASPQPASARATSIQIDASNQSSIASYTADELVAGVLFGVGPVAEKVEATIELPPGITQADYEQAVASFIDGMRQLDPQGFEQAAMQLTTGDVLAVDKGLTFLKTAAEEYAASKTPPGHNEDAAAMGPCTLFAVCFAAVFVVAAVVSAAAVANYAAVIEGAVMPSSAIASDALGYEQRVALLAERLAQ
ncbi:hypothetical protein [Nonomuraea rubra]|uniref:hypothetical protein n=1 Tax=Nonomuraea rubra TaxID=46180 RepID=UPI0033C770B2